MISGYDEVMGSYEFLDLSAEEQAAMRVVGKSIALLRREVDRKLGSAEGLTRAQFEILGHLSHSPDGLRMFELADMLTLSRSTMTHHVNHLEKLKLVTKEGGTSENRAVSAKITDAGLTMVHERRHGYAALIRKHFIDNFTPEELTIVTAGFTKVADSFGEDSAAFDARHAGHHKA